MKCEGRYLKEGINFLILDRSLRFYFLFTTLKTSDLSGQKFSKRVETFVLK